MTTGRPPEAGVARMEPICTRFTENEVGRMDDSRQERTRSSFIRAAVAEKIEREGLV